MDRYYEVTIAALAVFIFAVLTTHAVFAVSFTPTATEVLAQCDEPTTNVDGSPCDDLAFIRFYYRKSAAETPVMALQVNASSPSGGGHVTARFQVPVAQDEQALVQFWATAVDTTGNESDPSEVKTVRIDRLRPSPPR